MMNPLEMRELTSKAALAFDNARLGRDYDRAAIDALATLLESIDTLLLWEQLALVEVVASNEKYLPDAKAQVVRVGNIMRNSQDFALMRDVALQLSKVFAALRRNVR